MSRRPRRSLLLTGVEALEQRQMLHGGVVSEPKAGLLQMVDESQHVAKNAAARHQHAMAQYRITEARLHARQQHLAIHEQSLASSTSTTHASVMRAAVMATLTTHSEAHHAKAKHHKTHKTKHHKNTTTTPVTTAPVVAGIAGSVISTSTSSRSASGVVPGSTVTTTTGASGPTSGITPASGVGSPVTPPSTPVTPVTTTTTDATRSLAVGEYLDTKIVPGGIVGSGVTYTITPQPLPANMTFDRTTGKLTFSPAPGQGGHLKFTVTANGGAIKTATVVPIDVTSVPLAATTVSGRVVDELGLPLAGMPVSIGAATATTDLLGNFILSGVPANPSPINAGGSVANAETRQGLYAPVDQILGHEVYANAHNVITQPLILPRINWSSAASFTAGDATKPQTIFNPAMPGFSLQTVPGVSGALATLGSVKVGYLGADASAQHMVQGVAGGMFVVSSHGVDVTKPVTLSLPNASNLQPGATLQLSKLNVTTGGRDVIGTMTVSADGKTMTTDAPVVLGHPAVGAVSAVASRQQNSGATNSFGLQVSTNGVNDDDAIECLNYLPTGVSGDDNYTCDCPSSGIMAAGAGDDDAGGSVTDLNTPQYALASNVDLISGEYYLDHQTVTYQSQGQDRGIDLAYNSLQANPHPVAEYQFTVPPRTNASSITSITAQITVAGVTQGPAVTYNTSGGLTDGQVFNIPLQVDGSALATGSYPYKMAITENFGSGTGSGSGSGSGGGASPVSITTINEGYVNVVNRSTTPLGAGWSVNELQQISQATPGGPILANTGQLQSTRFDPVYTSGGYFQDLAASAATTGASVIANDGRGGFPTGTDTVAGASTIGVASGDFNGDSKLDMALLGWSTLVIKTNSGAGALTGGSTINLPSGYTARALAAGNFTGHTNGVLDLAVVLANTSTNAYAVAEYTGAGNGTFAAPVITAANNGVYGGNVGTPNSLTAGDFNGDGKLDLAFNTDNGLADVMLAASGGSFGAATSLTLTTGAQAIGVTTTDYNGDGKTDLIVQTKTYINSYATVGVIAFSGNGSGGLSQQGTYLTNGFHDSHTLGIVVGSFNGPSKGLEVAVPLGSDEGTIIDILPISAAGIFGAPTLLIGGTYNNTGPFGNIVAGDLNGAGKPSIAYTDGTNQVHLLLADPDSGAIQPARTVDFAAGSGTGTGTGSGSGGPTTYSSAVGMLAAGAFTGTVATPIFRGTPSDRSTIIHNNDGTWTRSYSNGTIMQYDAMGREVSETDRNGNTTTFAYVLSGQPGAGALRTMTDPVGLVTTLAFDSSGHLHTITDPAGRVTTVGIDSNNNLTSITDPDGAIEQYGYATPSNHLATTETNPDGHTATAHYNTFGQLTSETLFDGTSTTNIVPAESVGLLAPGQSSSTLPTYKASITDPNGHKTSVTYNRGSHPTGTLDATGAAPSFTYMNRGWVATSTDAAYRTTSYTYDGQGNVTSIIQPALGYGSGTGTSSGSGSSPTTETIVYNDPYGIPTSITDFLGLVTTFTLDAHGNILRRTDPDGLHEDRTYNAAGQPLTDTNRAGNTTSYAYDSKGRLTTITDSGVGSPHQTIGYDVAGDVTSATDELNHTTSMTYDLAGRVLTLQDTVQAAAAQATHFTYDPDGKLLSITDALGHVTTYTYNARDEVATMTDAVHQGTNTNASYAYDAVGNLMSITDMLGHKKNFTYDPDNRLASVSDGAGDVTSYNYDLAGELTSTIDPKYNQTGYAYDSLGNIRTVTLPTISNPDGPNQSGAGYHYSYVPAGSYTIGHDVDGNLLYVTDPLNHTTTNAFNSLNLQTGSTDALSHTMGATYDADLNRATAVDGLGHTNLYTFDSRDRLINSTEPAGGGTTSYTYDDANNLLSVTDPVGNVTRYTYDSANRVATETMPTGGVTAFTYDLVGNLTQKVDPLGRIDQYGYDANNRETTEKWLPVGGGSASYTMTLAYDAVGNLASVQDNFSRYTYVYDNADRVMSINNSGTTGSPQVTLTYGHDTDGNRTSLTDSLGGTYNYGYNARNQLDYESQSGSNGSGVLSELVFVNYDAANNLTGLTRYADTTAQTKVGTTSYVYDAANRLTSLTHKNSGGSTIASYGYTLDAASRLTSEVHTWNGGNSTDTINYGYTNNNQLTSVTHSNSSFANESFSYDSNGNRNASGQTTATGNEVRSDGTYNYAYDAAGNLISKTSIATGAAMKYQWDFRNRLVEVDSVSGGTTTVVARFTYDALNRQIEEVDDPNGSATTRWTVYDAQTPLLDFNGAGTQTARYLSVPGAIDEVLARQTSLGVAWYLDDREESVKDIINNSGTVIDHIDYTAFGQVATDSSPAQGDRFKYAGMEFDSAIGQYYDRARYYDSGQGRFTSQDPLSFRTGDADLYRYVGNDSPAAIDTTGLFQGPANPSPGPNGGSSGLSRARQIDQLDNEANRLSTVIKWDQDKINSINKDIARITAEIAALNGTGKVTLLIGIVSTCWQGIKWFKSLPVTPVGAGISACTTIVGYKMTGNTNDQLAALLAQLQGLINSLAIVNQRLGAEQADLANVIQQLANLGVSYPITYPYPVWP